MNCDKKINKSFTGKNFDVECFSKELVSPSRPMKPISFSIGIVSEMCLYIVHTIVLQLNGAAISWTDITSWVKYKLGSGHASWKHRPKSDDSNILMARSMCT